MKEKNDAGLEEAKKRIKEAKEKKLSRLDLGGLNLTIIPGEVFELTGLQLLNLRGNQFAQLPKEIAELKNLNYLGLRDNQLTQLPREIAQLKNLEYLSLSGNENLISPPPSVNLPLN